ncbi:MAG: hypothetical protein CK528_06780 [Alcaligenaceae bacterium]|nr:MAG: hypothetical protein CK528_06780 [Alcaligenaceae bacterium]
MCIARHSEAVELRGWGYGGVRKSRNWRGVGGLIHHSHFIKLGCDNIMAQMTIILFDHGD